ncbi:MAG: hypothetical protein ACK55O_15850 [Phycisphaerales bacterium]|jgi:hypothetical protein|nr:hypothetical protein [Phycisphaeraceae bacterium]
MARWNVEVISPSTGAQRLVEVRAASSDEARTIASDMQIGVVGTAVRLPDLPPTDEQMAAVLDRLTMIEAAAMRIAKSRLVERPRRSVAWGIVLGVLFLMLIWLVLLLSVVALNAIFAVSLMNELTKRAQTNPAPAPSSILSTPREPGRLSR